MPKDLLEGMLAAPSPGNSPAQGPKDLLATSGLVPEPMPADAPPPTTPAPGLMSLIGGDEQGIMQDPQAALQATRGAGKIGMGTVVGIEKPFAGLTQTAMEGLAKIGAIDPKTTEAFSKMQMDFQNKTGKEDALKDAGEVFGTGLSYLLPQGLALKLPGLIVKTAGPLAKSLEFLTATGMGAAQAGTEFHSPEEADRSRLTDAGWGAALSAAGQASVVPVQRLGTKVLNTAVIQDLVKDIKGVAEGFNVNASNVVDSFKKTFAGRQAALVRSQARQDLLGDAAHPTVDTSTIVAALEKAKESAPKGAAGALNDALKLLRNPPIKAGGTTVPPGSPLYASIMGKGGAAGAAKYSTVRRAVDILDSKIESASPEVSAALGEPRKMLGDAFDKLTQTGGNDLRLAAREAASRESNLDYMKDAKIKSIFRGMSGGETPAELNKKIIDAATGDDATRAQRIYNALTPAARDELKKGIAFRALDNSVSEGGTIDPAKFTKFMQENPNVQRFFKTPREKAIAEGMGNVVKEAALASGKTEMRRGHGIGRGLIGWGTWDLVESAMKGSTSGAAYGAGKVVTGMALLKFSNAFGKALSRSQRAESFFAAASNAKPGTPDSIRLFNRFMTTFGAAAGAEGGGSSGIRGNLAEMGMEKLIEPGMNALAQ